MISGRLRYRPVETADLDAFHLFVDDEHVRRYLMDGEIHSREWSAGRIRDSRELFARRGVGLWLAYGETTGAAIGFCGFLEIASLHPEPQLVYAMPERFTGRGYATEMARAVIGHARAVAGFTEVVASVDEANAASRRVLEKLGFERIAVHPGPLGGTFLFRLSGEPR